MMASDVMTLTGVLVRRWPHCEPVDSEYIADLADVHADHAFAAVDSWYRDGERFAPSGAQIIGRIADLALDIPDWYRVVAELERRQRAAGHQSWTKDRVCPLGRCDGKGIVQSGDENTPKHEIVTSYCECRDQMQTEIASRQAAHPVVAAFIEEIGQREIHALLEGDRVAEAQIRTKYEAFVRNTRRSVVYHGIDPAGLPALQRLQHEREQGIGLMPGARRGQLQRPDVAGTLTNNTGESA